MRIPVEIVRKRNGSKEFIYGVINGFISCRKPPFRYTNVKFMVDSGATTSCCITKKDFHLLGFEVTHSGVTLLPVEDWPNGFGGRVKTYIIKNVPFRCRGSESGKEKLFKSTLPEVQICIEGPPGLPSILGTEFLAQNKLRFVFSPTEDTGSYLEEIH